MLIVVFMVILFVESEKLFHFQLTNEPPSSAHPSEASSMEDILDLITENNAGKIRRDNLDCGCSPARFSENYVCSLQYAYNQQAQYAKR